MIGVILLLTLAQAPASDAANQFERGKTAFDRGEHARAITLLRPLIYPEMRLQVEGDIVAAHRMLGISHLYEKQNDLAAREFRKLLQLRPDYRFDTLLDNPQVVDFFNGVLREQETELAKIEAARKEMELAQKREREALERARNGPTIVEKRYARNSFAVNFIPFGAGQFQNGHRGKGWGFLLGEAALGAVSIGALATNFALYGPNPKRPACPSGNGSCGAGTAETRSDLLTNVQVVSGALFFGVTAWGIIDAIVHFEPEVPIRTSLAPVVLDGGYGAGFAFRF